MRRPKSIEAFALVALLSGTRPAGAEDKTSFIELDRRSEAFPGAVSVNGSVVVGAFEAGGGFYWMPTTGAIYIGGQQALGGSADGTRIVGVAYHPSGVENAGIWLRGTEGRVVGPFGEPGAGAKKLNAG